MEHFIRIVMEKQEELSEGLNDTVFPNSEIFESEQGATVFHIPLLKSIIEQESDEFADRLVEYMTKQGYEDFDIECPCDDETEELDEETWDGDDFLEYGVMWFNDEDGIDEAEYPRT